MAMKLRDYQQDAISRMSNGCILCGGVGSGKSITALAYYLGQNGSKRAKNGLKVVQNGSKWFKTRDLYIITTARKRDAKEWEEELQNADIPSCVGVTVDSWNNIKKYTDIRNAFFIFDEQRVVGYGAWTKSFLKITKSNEWILLSATPGDTWMDYIPVFIANGFYRNKTDFVEQHVVFDWHSKFPKVDRYLNTQRLIRLRERVLVKMDYQKPAISHHEDVWCLYDTAEYRRLSRLRWNPWTEKPCKNASEFCLVQRRIVNSSEDRQVKILELFEDHPRMIVFYNFDYELEILLGLGYGEGVDVAQWNGHMHQELPNSEKWVYLVQYNAGAEGWNCIKTDTVVFYSQNYSYKMMEQAAGRIDRLNTPFTDLYYYHFKSKSGIDLAIGRALSQKKDFNVGRYYYRRTK